MANRIPKKCCLLVREDHYYGCEDGDLATQCDETYELAAAHKAGQLVVAAACGLKVAAEVRKQFGEPPLSVVFRAEVLGRLLYDSDIATKLRPMIALAGDAAWVLGHSTRTDELENVEGVLIDFDGLCSNFNTVMLPSGKGGFRDCGHDSFYEYAGLSGTTCMDPLSVKAVKQALSVLKAR